MKDNKQEQILNDIQIKSDIVSLEKFYVDAQIDNLPDIVEEQKNNIVNRIAEYKEKYAKYETDKLGNDHLVVNNFVISNYFFRSINNLQNIEPKYSGEHLSILWNLYLYMVEQVNLNLCEFTPNISHFCKFIGITTVGLKKMLKSPDEGIQIVVQKIYDTCYDERMTMSETGKFNARATTFRMKSEMNINEKEAPQIVINTKSIDFDSISKRLNELNKFDKRAKEVKYEEKN